MHNSAKAEFGKFETKKNPWKMRISIALVVALAAVFVSNLFGLGGDDVAVSIPLTSIPTFSTEKIGRQGHFYVGGKWLGEPGKERMRGAMYVEVWVPKKIKHPYPIFFVEAGGGQTDIALLQTPDGRPGWAYDFANQGYTIYMMDFPGRGRAAYIPGLDGDLIPPRTAENMEELSGDAKARGSPESEVISSLSCELRRAAGADLLTQGQTTPIDSLGSTVPDGSRRIN
jgi:hypothetical protein